MTDHERVARALDAVPDIPRWIEARALLLSGHCGVFGSESGLVIRNEAPGGRLAVMVGDARRATLEHALSDRPARELLCAPEQEALARELIPHWKCERAVLYQLVERSSLAPEDPCVRLLESGDFLTQLGDELPLEIEGVRSGREVWTAFEDGRAASFAYSYWKTEGQFDISIDSVPRFRRRGLARRAVSALIRAELARGLEPVWGAMESNTASRRLAETLGFVELDELVLFTEN